jgi:hypothetical protein
MSSSLDDALISALTSLNNAVSSLSIGHPDSAAVMPVNQHPMLGIG